MRNCPSEFDLAALIDGALDEKEADAIRQHVVHCSDCSHALMDVVSLQDRESVDLLLPLTWKEETLIEAGLITAIHKLKAPQNFSSEAQEEIEETQGGLENSLGFFASAAFNMRGVLMGSSVAAMTAAGGPKKILGNFARIPIGADSVSDDGDLHKPEHNESALGNQKETSSNNINQPAPNQSSSPMTTGLVPSSSSIVFDPEDYTHPEDRAALAAVKAIPLFSQVLKAFMKACPEQMFHGLNMAQKIRLGPRQLPEIYNMLPPICRELGIEEPEFYLEMNPAPNAYTFGDTKVFVTVTSGLIESLDPEEVRAVIAHECGHIACRHTLYHTMATLILIQGVEFLGLPQVVLLPFTTALTYWSRRSEFSADRAAALITRGPRSVVETMIRLSGGPKSITGKVDLELYAQQADAYDQLKESKWDKLLQGAATLSMTHPMPAVRAREISRWCATPGFQSLITNGSIPRVKQEESSKSDGNKTVSSVTRNIMSQVFKK